MARKSAGKREGEITPYFNDDSWRWALANHGVKKEREGRANGLMMAAILVQGYFGIPEHVQKRLLKDLETIRRDYEPEQERGMGR